jgi:hypothetical protein
MRQLFNIMIGWWQFLFKNPFNQELVDLRVKTCGLCPHSKKVKFPARNEKGQFEWRKGLKCTVCKCPVEVKAGVEGEKCPIGRWPR